MGQEKRKRLQYMKIVMFRNEKITNMNTRKSKSLVISKRGELTPIMIGVNGAEIEQGAETEQVYNFIYFGLKITDGGKNEEEVKRRISIVRTVLSKIIP